MTTMSNQRREEDVLLREAPVEAQLQLQFRQYSDRINNNIALAEMAYIRLLEIYIRTEVDDVTQKAHTRSLELKFELQRLQESFAVLGATRAYRIMSLANRVLVLREHLGAVTKHSNELSQTLGDLNHYLSTLKGHRQ